VLTYTGCANKNNPLGKIHYLSYCNRFFLTKFTSNYDVKITENAPYGCANGLSCLKYYAGTLSKTHDKAGQRNKVMKDRFVDDAE